MLPDLANTKVFTKLDCKNDYWQAKLDKGSSILTTFNTPFGRYKWTRMPFQRFPTSLRPSNWGSSWDQDGGRWPTHHCKWWVSTRCRKNDTKLEALLGCCRERGIKLNEVKISLKKTSMPYISHLVTSDRVKADPSKVEAIANLTKPTDVPGVRWILGMINY